MKDIITVMKFTIKDIIRRKSFIISTLIILILIIIGFNVPNIIQSFNNENSGDKILIADNDNIFEGKLELLKQEDLGYNIEIEQANFEKIKEKIENKEIAEAIMIEKQENNIKIRYIVENTTIINEIPENIVDSISSLYTKIQIDKLGLTQEQLQKITPDFELNIEQTSEEKVSGNVFVMMLMSIVLFYAIYFCAYQVSSSITTEKTSKIMETLVTSTSPKTIVLRKNTRHRYCGIITVSINCRNSTNKCRNIFRSRIIKCSIRYV